MTINIKLFSALFLASRKPWSTRTALLHIEVIKDFGDFLQKDLWESIPDVKVDIADQTFH